MARYIVPALSQKILIGYADISERYNAYELNLAAESWTYFELVIKYTLYLHCAEMYESFPT